MKSSSKKHLRRTLLCALFAGSIAAPFAAQTAYALPIEGANAPTNAGEANISTSGTTMDITGKTEHNVLRWEDFSIDSGEKVRFDGGAQTRDYLNLVTGEGASNIYGTIEGGRNVYLVNPHGILFAKGSEVNTGALYLSTANVDAVASAAGTSWGGDSPLRADTQYGNVLNLGTVQANTLYIEGKNVTVLNTDAVTDVHGTALTGNAVTIRSAEAPHIGYDVGNRARANFDEGGGSMWRTFYNYKYPNTAKSASARGWDVANLGGTAHTDYDYMRVHTVYDLQNINAKRDGRYILAGDIDATATQDWNSGEGFTPLGENYGTQFTGRFDGAGHALRGLYINRPHENFQGLFGYASGARIENLSLVDGNVKGNYAVGGIVGRADDTEIRNVSYAGRVNGDQVVGGIVGYASEAAKIQNVCNTGAVSGTDQVAGGVVGYASEAAKIQNVCNTGTITGSKLVGGIVGAIDDSTLQHAWNTGTVTGNQKVGGIVGQALGGSIRHAVWKSGSAGQAVGASSNGADVTTDVKFAAEADMKLAATYTDWKDANGTALVATEGGKGTPWRIYNGHSMPLLTALMKGTKRLEKTYDGKTFGDGDAHILSDTALQKNVGTYDARGIYSDAFGYDLIGSTYRIAPRVLTMSGVASQTKTYDGTTAADAAQFHASLGNIVAGEENSVAATAMGAAYNDKNVAAANAVSYTGVALTGAGAGNYTLNKSTLTGIGTIAPRALTLGAVAAQSKTYDGTTAADTSKFGAVLNNVVAGDNVTATAAGAAYNDKNVAAANAVNYTGVQLTGTGAGNYTLAATTAQGAGTITRRALTVDTVAAQSKTYDGTTAADTSKFQATLGNVVAGEENLVTATAGGATYNDKNVAGANTVGYTGVALTGTGAGNYSLAATTAQGAGSITPKQLNLALAGGARFDKTYDGNANVTQSLTKGGNYTLTGFIGTEGDHLALASATGTYTAGKDARTDKEVTFKNLTLAGTGAGNYTLDTNALTGIGTISQRALTLGAVAAQTKTYDGTTAADASKFHAALGNVVAGEENLVTATATGAAYNDKNVARANAVSYTGVALRGTGAGNYTVATTAEGRGTITPRALTFGTVAAQTKTYDGMTAADAAEFRATLGNLVTGEESSVTATATGAAYNDKTVAGANKVNYTGVALTGAGAGNYIVANTAEGAGTITKRALTLGAVAAQTKIYDGTTIADASKFRAVLNNVVAGDSVTTTATGAAYNSKDVAAASTIDYTGVALAGAEAGNYTLAATTAQGAGTISRRALTVDTVAAQTKTYDGTTAADASQFHATLGNVVAGEENLVTATATGAAYNDKNVARANAVSYTGVALRGTGAGNYTVATTAEGRGTITPRALTFGTVAAQTKTYDGTTAADTSKFQATLNNVVAGEESSVTATATGATYNDKNVAGANKVSYTAVALTGTGAANYAISNTTEGQGRITPKQLNLALTGGARFDKTYDGTANVTQTLTKNGNYTLTNFVNGEGADIALAPVTGTYTDKNAGTGKAVTFGGLTLTGTGAGNYVLNTSTLAGTGTIAHRDLTLTADAQSIVQGEALPSFTGRADGFAEGENESVFGADGISFGTTLTNTDTSGSYGVTGRIGSTSDGILGNYRIGQAAGNATAFTIHAAALPGGLIASLVQNAAPRFDMGFGQEVYVFGLPRPIPTARLGIYRFRAARDVNIEGLRLD